MAVDDGPALFLAQSFVASVDEGTELAKSNGDSMSMQGPPVVYTVQVKGFYLSRSQLETRSRFRLTQESVCKLESNHDPLLKLTRNFSLPAPLGQANFEELESLLRENLGIPLGIKLRTLWLPDAAEHVELQTDIALNHALDTSPDEICVAVVNDSRWELWPWVSVLISIADVVTTIIMVRRVIASGDRVGRIAGIAVVCCCFFAMLANLVIGWRHVTRAKRSDPCVSRWVNRHHRETTVAIFMCGLLMNIITLEVLWSNVSVVGRINLHCPMQGAARSTLTGLWTVVSLILADAVPLALAMADTVYLHTAGEHAGLVSIASLVTSLGSLCFNLLKRFAMPQLMGDDDDARAPTSPTSQSPHVDAAVRAEELSVFRAELSGLEAFSRHPTREGEVCNRFHRDVRRVVSRHRGVISSFSAAWVEALFRDASHAARAYEAALSLAEVWAAEAALPLQRTASQASSSAAPGLGDVAVGVASGVCSHTRFGWGMRVQHVPFGPLPRLCATLAAVAADTGFGAVCNGACSRQLSLRPMRQVDRVLSDGTVHTVYTYMANRRQQEAPPTRMDSMGSDSCRRQLLRSRRASTPGDGQWGTVFSYVEQDRAEEAALAAEQLVEQLEYSEDGVGNSHFADLGGLSPAALVRVRAAVGGLHSRLERCAAEGHNHYCRALQLSDASSSTAVSTRSRTPSAASRPRIPSVGADAKPSPVLEGSEQLPPAMMEAIVRSVRDAVAGINGDPRPSLLGPPLPSPPANGVHRGGSISSHGPPPQSIPRPRLPSSATGKRKASDTPPTPPWTEEERMRNFTFGAPGSQMSLLGPRERRAGGLRRDLPRERGASGARAKMMTPPRRRGDSQHATSPGERKVSIEDTPVIMEVTPRSVASTPKALPSL